MAIKLYSDSECTAAILVAEKFTGQGPFNLVTFTGAQLGGVYKERKDSFSDIVFANGVGSGFVGQVVDSLKGQRVIHGNLYVGQIVSNTETTITISDLAYSSPAAACYLSSYTKLYTPTDFTISGNNITMVDVVNAGEIIHAIPTDALAMYFGGTAGTDVTRLAIIYAQRDENFEYTLLQVSSDDTSLFPYHQTTENVIFSSGTGSGFIGLAVNGLIGKALNHNGVYCGIIDSNTDTTVNLNNTYSGLSAAAEVYNIGSLEFSTDDINYFPVIALPDFSGAITKATIYVKDTLTIPTVAINYPSNIIKISGIEYIA